jgi:hypothetical protein
MKSLPNTVFNLLAELGELGELAAVLVSTANR